MRIVHTESSPVMGGQERRVLAESTGMRDRGHEVWIVTPAGGALAKQGAESGLQVFPVAFRRELLPVTVWRLRSLIRRLTPDIVSTHSSGDSWPCALVHAVERGPAALVRSRHISAPVRPGPLHRFLYRQPDHVITTGETIRHDLAQADLVPLQRSTSIPTAVDASVFRPDRDSRARVRGALGLALDTPVVGVVAFLRPDKGHTFLLEAMPELLRHHAGAVLLVAGDGEERGTLEAKAAHLKLGGRVRFLGRREDIPDFLPALDVFCLASIRNEGVPQALLQASASGLPVVGTRVGGIPEAVRHGETGTLVRAGDPDALATAVGALLSDAALRERLGRAGRAYVETAFSIDGMLDKTRRAYAMAIEEAARRRGLR